MPSGSPLKRRLLLWFMLFIVAAASIFALYTWAVLKWAYSTGERAGYVQKFSRKGWICKTWEGELAMVNLPGALTEKFAFTVPDEAVAARINASLGKRVAISYQQHMGLPSSCFGETSYFIEGVKVVE